MVHVDDTPLTARDKGLPARAAGTTAAEFLATGPRLAEFWTPLIALDDAAMNANIATMAAWCAERGLDIMPHGKTTMAPALWQRQLDAGATGITLATMGQVRTGRDLGLDSIMLANAAVDPRSLAWLAGELTDPQFRFTSWADSVATVEAMEHGLLAAGAPRPVDVCVELGAAGGRTGARSIDQAVRIAERIAASPALRLAGVAGYEGSLAHDRSPAALAAVRSYLEAQLELHAALASLYDDGEVLVTAGGSAYFDVVADVWAGAVSTGSDAVSGGSDAASGATRAAGDASGSDAASGATRAAGLAGRTRFTLRSGAYIVHDDGFYRGISPFDEGAAVSEAGAAGTASGAAASPRFVNAMHGLARVVSSPEPGLALIDAGKRDLPYDEGMPIPRAWRTEATPTQSGSPAASWGALTGAPWHPLEGEISAMNDQHSYLRTTEPLAIGSVVRLGLSHPCTAFDKWRVLPVVESAESDLVVDLIRTHF
ncbi:alanine racemase [Microbacterium sp. YJN-G]|uniref:alanine racemase n=1 Tax=Microbacterium sp. YJN-G TaxID=2763257 RepID=UPI001D0CBE22|nr:alanine racemase [Microbacterium sp. YJN-G]